MRRRRLENSGDGAIDGSGAAHYRLLNAKVKVSLVPTSCSCYSNELMKRA